MSRREPSDEAILAARLQRAYPSLSPYSSASLAQQLCAIERMQRLHAERWCNDPDYQCEMPRWEAGKRRIDTNLQRMRDRIGELHEHYGKPVIAPEFELQGDPRGAVLKVRLPGEAEAVSV